MPYYLSSYNFVYIGWESLRLNCYRHLLLLLVTFLRRWRDFGRSMFWLATIGGSLILLHALILVILKFRKKNSGKQSYGALALARFEIFLIILAVPCICEASVALIRGKFNVFLLCHI